MKTKKKKPEPVYQEPPREPDPTIPNQILKAFLDSRIEVDEALDVTQIKDGFLWQKGNIQRYRIDVWMSEEIPHHFCRRHFIGYSWFVHYDVKSKTITDKTLGEVVENKNKVKKLDGIADSNVRVGKSPW
ncbi:MAG: hypothetical protein ACXACT_17955 [Candidatus Thorarchaeota archaeon]|jgi:hypothetical protein